MGERKYWVGFNRVRGIGPVRVRLLLDHFGDLQAAWSASPALLKDAGLKGRPLQSLLDTRTTLNLDDEMERLDRSGAAVLTWEDGDYPRRLLSIEQPPPVLYVRGSLSEADDLALGVVGTRGVTAYGRQVTHDLTSQLARNGLTIVSGLARGIDGIAHRAALDVGGRTIAVLACGVDVIYPPEHRNLAHDIMQNGAIVSDYPLGTQPEANNFPPRNRIISGLSKGVLVVEAGIKSGALITADFAAEQSRDVFAVPGNITARSSQGANKLIQEGAHPVRNAEDILEVLNLSTVVDYVEARETLPTDPTEAALLKELEEGPLHADELSLRCDLPVAQVSSTLVMMELKGMVQQVGHMVYART